MAYVVLTQNLWYYSGNGDEFVSINTVEDLGFMILPHGRG